MKTFRISSLRTSADVRVEAESIQLFLANWRVSLLSLLVVTWVVYLFASRLIASPHWTLWVVCATVNALSQVASCGVMETAPTSAATGLIWRRGIVTLVAINGLLWGSVPFIVGSGGGSSEAVVFVCLLNAMLLFCISSTPGPRIAVLAAALAVGTPSIVALAVHLPTLPYVAVGYAMLIALLSFYGMRTQAAVHAAVRAGHQAELLTVELRIQQQRLVEVERERTLLLERQRLTRDMHDGLGSALVASLVAVERGEIHPERLAASLRDCIEDLRNVLDSLEPTEHDLAVLLGTLRLRIEPRLAAAGVTLNWEMEDLPPLLWLGSPEALHVMRIVQEILNNVLKHASASAVRLAARSRDGSIEIDIEDDGTGFDTTKVSEGRGLRFIEKRAAALGGTMRIDSDRRGTRIRLVLSVEKEMIESHQQR